MNIKISVYDFFAYTIPGSLLLFSVPYTLIIFDFVPRDVLLFSPSPIQVIIILGSAYVVGLLFEPIGKFWYGRFRPKNHSEVVLAELKKRYPSYDIHFHGHEWTVLLAYIRRENPEVASEIERVNATNIMLRNISFVLIVLAVIELVRFALGLNLLHLIISLFLIIFSVISGREAVKFAQWFYLGIFENILSTALQLPQLVSVPQAKVKNQRQ